MFKDVDLHAAEAWADHFMEVIDALPGDTLLTIVNMHG